MDSIVLRLTSEEEQELMKRYEESRQEYPKLTMDSFITWGVRFWLEQMRVMEKQRKEESED